MIGVCCVVIGICVVSYTQFQYAGLDLGIYNQVLWNTAHGRLFEFTFNESSYLVDHREWLLILLTPIYWVVNQPLVLVVIQSVIVNSVVIPMYLLARTVFDGMVPHPKKAALFVAAAVLLHPTILNMQLFEFHVLALTAPLAVWWWYGIVTQRRFRWVFFIILLLMREDVAITTAGVGVLLYITEQKRWKEAAVIVIASVMWFAAMVWAGGYFSVEDNPLFFSLYSWMGTTPLNVLQYMALHPLAVLRHVLSAGNIFLFLLFLMSTAFLPLLAFRRLFPALLGLSVYFFMGSIKIGMDIFLYHYGVLITIWTCIAALYGYRRLFDDTKKWKVPFFTQKDMHYFAAPIVMVVLFSTWVFFGLHWALLDIVKLHSEDRSGLRAVMQDIPADASVMASDRVYPYLSSRQFLYSTKYINSGLKHYSSLAYQFRSFDWLVMTDEVARMQNGSSIQTKANSVKRLRYQLQKNALVPVRLFEQGVLYGPAAAAPAPSEPVRSAVGFVSQVHANQRVHPTARLDGYTYDDATRQFSLQLTRMNDDQAIAFRADHEDDQELFVRVLWHTRYGLPASTQYRLLGSATDPMYLWGNDESRVMQLPWIFPEGATDVRLEFGSLYLPPQHLAVTQTMPLMRKPLPLEYTDVTPIVAVDERCKITPTQELGSCSVNTK